MKSSTNRDKFYIKVNDVALSSVNGIYGTKSGENTINLKAGDVISIQFERDNVWDPDFGAKFSYTERETA